MIFPGGLIVTQVSTKCFLSPRTVYRVTNWAECRNRAVALRVKHANSQGAVAAHRVAANGARIRYREVRLYQSSQFVHYVIVHLIRRFPCLLRGIYIQACALAEVVSSI